jgi:hypothetical protein
MMRRMVANVSKCRLETPMVADFAPMQNINRHAQR